MHRRRVESVEDKLYNATVLHLGLISEALGLTTTLHSLYASDVIMATHMPTPCAWHKGPSQGMSVAESSPALLAKSWALKHRSGRVTCSDSLASGGASFHASAQRGPFFQFVLRC